MSAALDKIELSIEGMTCASCAARVEKKLNRMDGVEASVNYATETAIVLVEPDVDTADLIRTVEQTGYGASSLDAKPEPGSEAEKGTSPEADSLRQRLIISMILAVPVIILSMLPPLQFRNWQWLAFALASPVVIWGALPFHRAAWVNLRHASVTMDTLISVGVAAAYGWSLFALFLGDAGMPGMTMDFSFVIERGGAQHELYLEVAAAVTTFLLAGRYFETRAKDRSGSALRALLDLGAKDVVVLRQVTIDGVEQRQEERVPIGALAVGDLFVVRPGEKVATDGVVVEGRSAVDVSLVTGESVPVEVAPGEGVIGATLNSSGRLVVEATRVGSGTMLAQMVDLVRAAQSGKAPVQRLADQISAVFVPVVIGLSLATLAFWLLVAEEPATAFTAAVAVLIIACPCALGLATPTALLVGTGRGAQLGILITGPEILESTRRVDTVVLDKTGTVTTGQMTLRDAIAIGDTDVVDLLRFAGSLEHASAHPIAIAISDRARNRLTSADFGDVEDFESHHGSGVTGVVDGHTVVVGTDRLLVDRGVHPPAALTDLKASAEAQGSTAILVAWDGEARGLLVIADALKQTSADAVAHLKSLGMCPVLLTGDNEGAARYVADSVGIDRVVAGAMPNQKLETIRRLQREGAVVAMVGDGVNDAAALAQADLGIAMGAGTDAAIAASDLTLVNGDLRSVGDAIRLSRHTLRTIKGNLFWAFAYNVAAIPLAAAGLLNPMIAGAAMALSSAFVVSNSLRLRRFEPKR